MLLHVTYLTGVRYTFGYLMSGELIQITYPTLGTSFYAYSNYYPYDRALSQNVYDHYVTGYSTGGQAWSWNYTYLYASKAAPDYVTVTVPGHTSTIHYMQKSGPGWADGFVTKVARSDYLEKRSRQEWTQDDEQLATMYSPRISWAKSTQS